MYFPGDTWYNEVSMIQNLLMLALSLLIAAQQPNVPQDLKEKAVNVAVFAIQTAQAEQNKPTLGIGSPANQAAPEVNFGPKTGTTTVPKQTGPGFFDENGCFHSISPDGKYLSGTPLYCLKK